MSLFRIQINTITLILKTKLFIPTHSEIFQQIRTLHWITRQLSMPEKVVSRLLKESLPDHVNISKDAKNAACRFASIFILQVSIAAAEKAQDSNRDTLQNQDIIKAVTDLGLGEYASQLVRFGAQRKRNAKRKETGVTTKGSKPSKNASVEDSQQPLEGGDQLDQESNDMQVDQGENNYDNEESSHKHNNSNEHDLSDHDEDQQEHQHDEHEE